MGMVKNTIIIQSDIISGSNYVGRGEENSGERFSRQNRAVM